MSLSEMFTRFSYSFFLHSNRGKWHLLKTKLIIWINLNSIKKILILFVLKEQVPHLAAFFSSPKVTVCTSVKVQFLVCVEYASAKIQNTMHCSIWKPSFFLFHLFKTCVGLTLKGLTSVRLEWWQGWLGIVGLRR
jgi:hypothetical protein